MSAMRQFTRLVILVSLAAGAASCGDLARTGRAPVFLVLDSLGARAGGQTGTPTSFLQSDVLTLVTSPAPCTSAVPCPTIVNDSGLATFHLALKDIGSPGFPNAPSSNNQVTLQ